MNKIVILIVIVAVLLIIFGIKYFNSLSFPPHEFAYGMPLNNIKELSTSIDRFLSLTEIDQDKIEIETYAGNNSSKDLNLLIQYISKKHPELTELSNTLEQINKIEDTKQKALKLIEALLPYKDKLRDDANMDQLIVFIYFQIKQPNKLLDTSANEINTLVNQMDTAKQSKRYLKGNLPKNYIYGNINVYPLSMENLFWHKNIKDRAIPDKPILEIRFMGLRGIFKHLLNTFERQENTSFLYLDGERI